MTDIDSTAIPGYLAEENLFATVEDAETYVSKLSEPLLVLMTLSTTGGTALPAYSISGRTITFSITSQNGDTYNNAKKPGYYMCIKGRL